jgi:hypothetical protein
MAGSLGKEHAAQVVYTVISLALLAGGMLAGAVWYLSADINSVAQANNAAITALSAANNAAILRQWQTYEDEHAITIQRLTTLEAERSDDREQLSRDAIIQDQIRAALNDVATSVAKLTAALPHDRR